MNGTPRAFAPTTIHARDGFLDRYAGGTRHLYELDMRIFFDWCITQDLDPLDARRVHLDAFGRHLTDGRGNSPRSAARRLQTVRSFYRLAVADELVDRDPTLMMRMPRWHVDRATIPYTTPRQAEQLLAAAADTSPAHHALIALMAYLGLRISEACRVQIKDLTETPLGYVVLTGIRKGGRPYEAPIPIPLLRILHAAQGDRTSGPLILTRAGNEQTRHGGYDWFRRLAKRAGLPPELHPHSLRHGCARMLLAAGVPIEEVQAFMGHADIRTTMHYAASEMSHDRHPVHVAARQYARAA